MRNSTSSVLLAASLAAVATAQGHRGFDGFESSAPSRPGSHEEFLAGGGVLAVPEATAVRWRGAVPRQQEPDYSLRGLFQQQHGDFMLKYQRFDPQVKVRAQVMPNAEIKGEDGDFDLGRIGIDIEQDFMVSTDGYLTLGGYFDQRRYVASRMPGFNDENLYAAGIKLGFGVFLDDNVLLEALFAPGAWSDLDGSLKSKDYDYPSRLLFTFRTSDDFFLKLGVRYNEVFEDANVLPYLGISWQISPEFRLDILLPELVEFSWWPTPEFGIQVGAEIQGAEYHVRERNAGGTREYADARVQEVITYAGALWRMSDYTSLGVRAGVVVAGDYKLDDGLAATDRVNGMLRPAFFGEITFGLEF